MQKHSLVDRLSNEDNFIKLYKFTLGLGSKLDVILCALINAETWVDEGLSDDPDYFRCNVQGFMNSLLRGYSDYEIRNSINKLCEMGLISKRSVNIDGKQSTYIKLNTEEILALKKKYEEKREPDGGSLQVVSRGTKSSY